MSRKLRHEDYTVGWICPLEVEYLPAVVMLDEEHERLPQPPHDYNAYTLGSIHGHNVVIACLPGVGNSSAATAATQMRNTFTSLRFVLLVGIGGGVPTKTDNGYIKLGDLVVSKPEGAHSGVVQYDRGKAMSGTFQRTGSLAPPPKILLNVAQELAIRRDLSMKDPLEENLKRIDTSCSKFRRYRFPGREQDRLYEASYEHKNPNVQCTECGCDSARLVHRDNDDDYEDDDEEEIVIHRGNIASGEMVINDGQLRDKLAAQLNVLCFDTEAAGVLDDTPCLVIRGISHYSDSHANNQWQGYAAAVAAAYARQLFFHLPIDATAQAPKVTASKHRPFFLDEFCRLRGFVFLLFLPWMIPSANTISRYMPPDCFDASVSTNRLL